MTPMVVRCFPFLVYQALTLNPPGRHHPRRQNFGSRQSICCTNPLHLRVCVELTSVDLVCVAETLAVPFTNGSALHS